MDNKLLKLALFKERAIKIHGMKNAGYNLVTIWESEWNKIKKLDSLPDKIQNKVG